MLSEADLIAKRAALRWLAQQHPEWTHQDLADALSMSRSWVSKWLQRLHQADPTDVMALHSRSRARHTPPASIASQPAIVQRILEIRLEPPENLQRVPGPEAILYYVHRDPVLKQAGVRLPRSQTTVWKILRQAGCIEEHRRRKPKPLELRQPGEEVQFDLKDASSVPADPEGKRQHVVEIANFVDAGTSIWLNYFPPSSPDWFLHIEAFFKMVEVGTKSERKQAQPKDQKRRSGGNPEEERRENGNSEWMGRVAKSTGFSQTKALLAH